MLRVLVRLVGWIALAAAFASAVVDGARSIANSRLELTPLGAALAALNPAKFAQLPVTVSRIHPKLWDPVLIDALSVPTSVALLVIGVALTAIAARGRRKRAFA